MEGDACWMCGLQDLASSPTRSVWGSISKVGYVFFVATVRAGPSGRYAVEGDACGAFCCKLGVVPRLDRGIYHTGQMIVNVMGDCAAKLLMTRFEKLRSRYLADRIQLVFHWFLEFRLQQPSCVNFVQENANLMRTSPCSQTKILFAAS